MKKKPVIKKKVQRKKKKPALPWQVGEYAQYHSERIRIPPQLLLICKIFNIPPMDLIDDFLNNAALSAWKREGNDTAREKVIEYLIACGYGKDFYSDEERRQILKEADAQGILWPKNADIKLFDLAVVWRQNYHKYWFDKWFWKGNRKLN
jgi:hypothetical protein